MKDEHVVLIFSAIVAGVILSFVGCSMYEAAQIARMVEAGADPIEAACANRRASSRLDCIIYARDKKEPARCP